MDKSELKIQALKESISKLVSDYEEKDAERRVEITYLTQLNTQQTTRIEELELRVKELEEASVLEEAEGNETKELPDIE